MDTLQDHINDSCQAMLGISEDGFKQYLQEEYGISEKELNEPAQFDSYKEIYGDEFLETLEAAHNARRGKLCPAQ
jgi:hypothetical protein